MAFAKVAMLFGTSVAETILASVHVRAQQKAGHMDASDLIKLSAKHLARRGPSTYECLLNEATHRGRRHVKSRVQLRAQRFELFRVERWLGALVLQPLDPADAR